MSLSLLGFDHAVLVKIKVSCQQQRDRKLRGLSFVKILPVLCFLMMRTQISQALKCLGIMGFQNSQFSPSTVLTLRNLCSFILLDYLRIFIILPFECFTNTTELSFNVLALIQVCHNSLVSSRIAPLDYCKTTFKFFTCISNDKI